MLFSFYAPLSDPGRNATVLRIWGASIHRAKKALAIIGVCDDIVAVRHDLPHMPSLGVSSLDSRPPWRHGGLLFSPVPDLFRFVRCALSHCGAAFAGAFRPALGSFGRQTARFRIAQFQRQRRRRGQQILLQRGPSFCSDDPPLIEVERPGDLNLNRMDTVGGLNKFLLGRCKVARLTRGQ